MAEIVVTEFMDEAAVAGLAADFDVLYDAGLADRPESLGDVVADCRGLIVRNRTQVRGALLQACERLEVVGRLGVGLDNIDVDACAARRIAVIPATGANALAVAEYVIGTALLLLRGTYFATAEVAAGHWPRSALSHGREIAGKTLGIVGYGGIGRESARLGRALGMRVIGFDPQVPATSPLWTRDGTAPRSFAEVLAEARSRGEEVGAELADVRAASAEALQTRAENENLRRRVAELESSAETASLQIDELRRRERQNWFLIGAAVLLVGIVIGLVAPTLRRKRRSSW